MKLTIKNQFIYMAMLGLFISGLIVGYSYYNILKLNSALDDTVASSAILRNQMYANIMHDDLSSDVNAALLAAENNDSAAIVTIEHELEKHSASFLDALNKNDKLISDNKIHEALVEMLPAVHEYIATATSIVQTAKTNRVAAMSMMNKFRKTFELLGGAMASLSELLERSAKKAQDNLFVDDNEDYAAITLSTIWVVGTLIMIAVSYIFINGWFCLFKYNEDCMQ